MGFHTDLQKLSVILRRNLFPENLINKYISKYIQTSVKGGKTHLFNVKDAVPEGLRTRLVYKFSCASCNACYSLRSKRFLARFV